MEQENSINAISWDTQVFGRDCYEITEVSQQILDRVVKVPAHYSIKVNPLSSKKLLNDYQFYYCDTLMEASCKKEELIYFHTDAADITRDVPFEEYAAILKGAFVHGRYHRDFNIDKTQADFRYERWLKELYDSDNVLGLLFEGHLAGFFAFSGPKIALHALSTEFRGKGISKYLWSVACRQLFAKNEELFCVISVSNVPVLNLYTSLGFRFRNPKDVYHRLIT